MLPTLVQFGPFGVRSFSLFLVLAFVMGTFIFWKKAREEYYEEEDVIDAVLISVFAAILGGRLLYIWLHFGDFGLNLFYWLALWSKPGLYWLGFYVAGGAMFVRFAITHKWDIYKSLDLGVIGLAFCQCLVNVGLFLGGGRIGKVTEFALGMVFPGNYEARHPLALYAAVWWLIVFGFLWWVEGRYRRFVWYQRFKGDAKPGFLVFSYLIAFGLIGVFLANLKESEYIVMGVDLDLMWYISISLVGLLGMLARSGWGAKWGLDDLLLVSTVKKRKK